MNELNFVVLIPVVASKVAKKTTIAEISKKKKNK